MSPPQHGATNYDHDKWGWVMVAVTFLCWVVIMGNTKALGVLLIPISGDLDSDLWLIGWMAVLYCLMQQCLGPIVGALSRLLGSRPMMLCGGVFLTLGFILTATTSDVAAMNFLIVGLSGFGSAQVLFTSIAVMSSYFKEKYALAIGLSTMGVPVGVMAYGPMTQVFLDTYGWRGTILLLGIISFHLVPCGMLMRRDRSSSTAEAEQYQEVAGSDGEVDHQVQEERGDGSAQGAAEEANSTSPHPGANRARVCCQTLLQALDLSLLTDVRFLLLVTARSLVSFTYSGTVVFMVPHGQVQGLSVMQASFLPTAFGVGNVVGKLLLPLAQRFGAGGVPMTAWACLGAGLVGASFVLNAFVRPFVAQLILNALLGLGMGVIIQATDVIVRFLSTDDRLISLLGWQGLCTGVAGILGGLVPGWIYEWRGSFSLAFYVYGGLDLLSVPFFIAQALYAKRGEGRAL